MEVVITVRPDEEVLMDMDRCAVSIENGAVMINCNHYHEDIDDDGDRALVLSDSEQLTIAVVKLTKLTVKGI